MSPTTRCPRSTGCSSAELALRDARDLADQTVIDPVTGEVLAGVESGGIRPGATRQDVGYLSDPAIGGVRFGFPSLGTEAAVSTGKKAKGGVDFARSGACRPAVRQTSVTRTGKSAEVMVSGVDELGNAIPVTVEGVDQTIADPDLRWRPLGDPVRLNREETPNEVTWKGTVDLTAANPPRLVIEELEPGQQTDGRTIVAVETVVWVEVVELPPA